MLLSDALGRGNMAESNRILFGVVSRLNTEFLVVNPRIRRRQQFR